MQSSTIPSCELSIVMPCLDEEETIGTCVQKALSFLTENNVHGEVIVADNGSTDSSVEIATKLGARVVHVELKGYGSAIIGGVLAAKGKYIIMGDSDDSHDLLHLMPFLEKLRQGYDLVVGNRFQGGIERNAMSFINRYIGNPILSGIGRIFFRIKIRDFHCGLRGFTKVAFKKMDLRTSGMEFASEIIVKAALNNLSITEVPTVMHPAGRTRPPHLRSFRDGWRHLRFLLLYSPRWLFLYPGFALIIFGIIIGVWLLPGSRLSLDVHTMLYAAAAIIIGLQSVSFAILTKTFAVHEKLLPEHKRLNKLMQKATLEKGLIAAGLLIGAGLGGALYSLYLLKTGDFGGLGITMTLRIVILSITLMIVGFQIAFSSFFYSILNLKLFHDGK